MEAALRPSVPSSLRPSVSPLPTRRERTRRPAALERLDEAAAVVVAGDSDRARILLADILADSPAQGTAEQRLARLFATALLARLRGAAAETGNLYRDGADPGAMLAAFQTLVEATPIVRFGYLAATRALIASLGGARRIHLVDIGVGTGAQWHHALGEFARELGPIDHLRLTGIDLPEPGPDPAARLRVVGQSLQRRAAEVGLPFEFEPVAAQAEDLMGGRIRRRPEEVLAVNAAFAIHHVLPAEAGAAPGRDRDALLGYLRALEPRILTLIEPDLEHNALPFLPRVRESAALYLAVFELLAALLPPGLPARGIIEDEFFGREIRNIVAGEGPSRVERHERREAWRRRLTRQGFGPLTLDRFVGEIDRALRPPAGCSVGASDGMLVLAWRDRPVIAASAWSCRG